MNLSEGSEGPKLTMTEAMMGQLMSLLGTGFSFISQHLETNVLLSVIQAVMPITATRWRASLLRGVKRSKECSCVGTGSEFLPRVLQVYPTYDPRDHENKRDSCETKREESV